MNKLVVRLILAFLLVGMVAGGGVALIATSSLQNSFSAYLSQQDRAILGENNLAMILAYYALHGSWEGFTIISSGQGVGRGNNARNNVETFLAGLDGRIQASTQPEWLGIPYQTLGLSRVVPLEWNTALVGYWGEQTPATQALNLAEQRFRDEMRLALVLAVLIGSATALVIGAAMARSLARPLRHLQDGAQQLAQGALGAQIPIPSLATDEIRAVSSAFNQMSQRLQTGEATRQRMAADIAHELRTPVSVLRAHLEAMMDGIYALDGTNLAVAYDQTLHLARLVADLRLLTQAEAREIKLERHPLEVAEFAERLLKRFQPLALDAELTLELRLEADKAVILADGARLQQILDNLLSNAVRHTPAGGIVRLEVYSNETDASPPHPPLLCFKVCNSGMSLSEAQLARVFDRFWRGDDARQRDSGGSGLGLAIARQLALLHGGDLHASNEAGMTCFTLSLPSQAANA